MAGIEEEQDSGANPGAHLQQLQPRSRGRPSPPQKMKTWRSRWAGRG